MGASINSTPSSIKFSVWPDGADVAPRAGKKALWDCRINRADKAVELWCGDGSQPWFIPRGGGTGWQSSVYTEWVSLGSTAQTWYIMIDDSLAPTLRTTPPDYESGEFGVAVAAVNSATSYTKLHEGVYHLPCVPGSAESDLLVWDADTSDYIACAPLDEDAEGSEINIGGGEVVSGIAISETAGKLLQVTKSPLGPSGDDTNVAMRWNNTTTKWAKALPVEDTNDEQSGDLGAGDRVVVGAKTGSDGNLIQLVTKPLAAQGGVPPGYADGTVFVDMQWDSSGKKIQVKTATALVKTDTTSAWTDKVTFAQFND
jgi:hypothetical protein